MSNYKLRKYKLVNDDTGNLLTTGEYYDHGFAYDDLYKKYAHGVNSGIDDYRDYKVPLPKLDTSCYAV